MKLFCKLGLHSFHTSPDGMTRYCPNCGQWELNTNLSLDPIKRWKIVTWYEVRSVHDKRLLEGKYL